MSNPVQYLQHRALLSPQKICLYTEDGQYSYSQTWQIVKRLASKLAKYSIKPSDILAMSFQNPSWELFFTLAGFYLGCQTCSSQDFLGNTPNIKPALFLTDYQPNSPSTQNNQVKKEYINDQWLKSALSDNNDVQMYEYAPNMICRIILSSGTTGTSKAIPISYQTLEGRLKSGLFYWCTQLAEVNFQKLSTVGGFFTALDRLYLELPIYLSSNPIDLLKQRKIQAITASPTQVSNLIKYLKNNRDSISKLDQVTISGGALSEKLYSEILLHLCDNVRNVYGSTEVGGVSIFHLSPKQAYFNIGKLLPDVQVEIIPSSETKLSQNINGMIRIKSPHMAIEYLNDSQSTHKSFKDGWFYPGDIGQLTKDGLLILGGRESELINCGGVKVDPQIIDNFILEQPAIDDVAVFGVEDESGVMKMVAAIVTKSPEFNLNHLQDAILKKFGKLRTPTLFIKLEKIPRNAMGKAMRAMLSKAFRARISNN